MILLCLSALRDEKGECYKFGGAKFYGYGDAHIEIKGIDEGLKNECINAYKNLLKKSNFNVDSRIESLRKVSKQQSTLNNPKHKESPKSASPRNNRFKQDDDDDWQGL